MLCRLLADIKNPTSVRRCLRQFSVDEAGVTAVEYGLMLAGIALFILVTIFVVGDELDNLFQAVQTKLANSYT